MVFLVFLKQFMFMKNKKYISKEMKEKLKKFKEYRKNIKNLSQKEIQDFLKIVKHGK